MCRVVVFVSPHTAMEMVVVAKTHFVIFFIFFKLVPLKFAFLYELIFFTFTPVKGIGGGDD